MTIAKKKSDNRKERKEEGKKAICIAWLAHKCPGAFAGRSA
jgi:hypothetical protein